MDSNRICSHLLLCSPCLPEAATQLSIAPLHPTTFSRVGVYRTLKLGGSLKDLGDGAYMVDMSERGAHKTSAVFGPTKTTVTEAVAERIHALVQMDSLRPGEYLFHATTNRKAPLEKSAWTRFVKSVFEAYANVPLSPKGACRASVEHHQAQYSPTLPLETAIYTLNA